MPSFAYKGNEPGENITVDITGPDDLGTCRMLVVTTITERIDGETITRLADEIRYQRLERGTPQPWSQLSPDGVWFCVEKEQVDVCARMAWVSYAMPIKKSVDRKPRTRKNYGEYTVAGPDLETIRQRLVKGSYMAVTH